MLKGLMSELQKNWHFFYAAENFYLLWKLLELESVGTQHMDTLFRGLFYGGMWRINERRYLMGTFLAVGERERDGGRSQKARNRTGEEAVNRPTTGLPRH